MSLPLYFPPSPFDLEEARECGKLVNAAYQMYADWKSAGKPDANNFDYKPNVPGYTFSKPIAGYSGVFPENKLLGVINKALKMDILGSEEPFAFVARDEQGRAFLAIRGTESTPDWESNLNAEHKPYELVKSPDYGTVHDGFRDIYHSMSSRVLAAFKDGPAPSKIFITGHSLGGSLASLAVPDVQHNSGFGAPMKSYTFASPRVGSPQFAETYNEAGVPTYRFVNTPDIVPNVPPALLGKKDFAHVGQQVSYTCQYHTIVRNHSCPDSYVYAIENPDSPFNDANLPDDLENAPED